MCICINKVLLSNLNTSFDVFMHKKLHYSNEFKAIQTFPQLFRLKYGGKMSKLCLLKILILALDIFQTRFAKISNSQAINRKRRLTEV